MEAPASVSEQSDKEIAEHALSAFAIQQDKTQLPPETIDYLLKSSDPMTILTGSQTFQTETGPHHCECFLSRTAVEGLCWQVPPGTKFRYYDYVRTLHFDESGRQISEEARIAI